MENSNNSFFLICLASFFSAVGVMAWCITEKDDSLLLRIIALFLLCMAVLTFVVFRSGLKKKV